MNSQPETELTLIIPAGLSRLMRLLVSRGIKFEAAAGMPVKNFLKQVLPASDDYLENKIQTIFMDGRAVDDTEQTQINTPCTIALSAAMPGVFGAAFRKKGIYSGMRAGYTQRPDTDKKNFKEKTTVPVTLKCFNQVAEDIGDALLGRGVNMDIKEFEKFWKLQQEVLEKNYVQLYLNNSRVNASGVTGFLAGKAGELKIKIETET
ncbi:MAG: hypothetical protein ACLFNW_07470 [Desulfobacterales bacterium]